MTECGYRDRFRNGLLMGSLQFIELMSVALTRTKPGDTGDMATHRIIPSVGLQAESCSA
jgi:hypothetical protein